MRGQEGGTGMWLAEQQKRETAQQAGAVGEVTLSGEAPAVALDSERRGLTVYAPGGYRWRPAAGQKVLVLKADGEPCIVGAPSAGGLEPGEVALESGGGASLRLSNQGTVALGDNVAVTGSLYVGGVELKTLIRTIAAQVAAEMWEE